MRIAQEVIETIYIQLATYQRSNVVRLIGFAQNLDNMIGHFW